MEQSPEKDYIEANRVLLLDILSAGDELGLYHAPAVTVAFTGEEKPRTEYEGRPVDAYDPDTQEGLESRHAARMLVANADSFQARLHITLVGQAYVEFMEAVATDPDRGGDEDIEAQMADTVAQIAATIGRVTVVSSNTTFVDTQTGEHYDIALYRAINPDGNLLGREISIDIYDDLVHRICLVSEFGQGDQARLNVMQQLMPSSDSEIVEIGEFFEREHQDKESFAAIMNLFQEGLAQLLHAADNQVVSAELQAVYEKYPNPEDHQKIDRFVGYMRRKVADFKEQHELQAMLPGTDLPSFDELQSYIQLLNDMRT
jgi:hypothetical protein